MLRQTALVGVEGQRLMHALKQPHMPMAEPAAASSLAYLGTLPDRQAVLEQRIRLVQAALSTIMHMG